MFNILLGFLFIVSISGLIYSTDFLSKEKAKMKADIEELKASRDVELRTLSKFAAEEEAQIREDFKAYIRERRAREEEKK